MADYRKHLADAVSGADDLICTARAIMPAVDMAGSAGAVRVLVQGMEAHALKLKALQLCGEWEANAHQQTAFGIDAELGDAKVLAERVRVLLRLVCEEYFNERANDPATENGRQGIVGGFHEYRALCWSANAFAVELDAAIAKLAALMSADGEGVKSA